MPCREIPAEGVGAVVVPIFLRLVLPCAHGLVPSALEPSEPQNTDFILKSDIGPGGVISKEAGKFADPNGIAFDKDGNIRITAERIFDPKKDYK